MNNPYAILALAWTACLGEDGYALSGGGGGGGKCIEFPCVWQPELGTLERVSTWDQHEHAYRMNGTPARIVHKFDSPQLPSCLEVELTANVAKDAQLELQFDFGADGVIDARQPISPGEWKRKLHRQTPPSNTRHMRLLLEKQGVGEAAINYIHVGPGTNCSGPPPTLPDGAPCLDDATCTSHQCVLGRCSPCGVGGCGEGVACRDGRDCMSGACAAGVCRACAATESCARGESCSAASQCASRHCIFGSQPSLVRYPSYDGVCGECAADADCASGRCVLGQCSACATNADCPSGQRCRYQDLLEATTRACLPRFDGVLPRGALCEEDIECSFGLRCAAPAGRAKRCGVACGTGADCAGNEVCTSTGSIASTSQAGIYELTSAFREDARARVTTCYPIVTANQWLPRCEAHGQCPSTVTYPTQTPLAVSVCCDGYCSRRGIDLETSECGDYELQSY